MTEGYYKKADAIFDTIIDFSQGTPQVSSMSIFLEPHREKAVGK